MGDVADIVEMAENDGRKRMGENIGRINRLADSEIIAIGDEGRRLPKFIGAGTQGSRSPEAVSPAKVRPA